MATPSFLFQGIKRNNDHEAAILGILQLDDLEKVIFSVAFARKGGVKRLADKIRDLAQETEIYVGIRNGVTSAQALTALLKTGAKVFAVDTGSYSTLFHPKIYLSYSAERAYAIIGSANLTYSGLNENIEGSTFLELNRAEQSDESYLNDITNSIISLPHNHPQNVFRIGNDKKIASLLRQGRLEDESIALPPNVSKVTNRRSRDNLSKINLHKRSRPRAQDRQAREPIGTTAATSPISENWELIWTSNGLTERDLNIPTGASTHATGSMLLKKGQMENVDQRHYFRNIVFQGLAWTNDTNPRYQHLERAEADFEIVVKGINYGTYALKLTHNTRTDTRAYEQRNAMTQIHWGEAKNIIAKSDLLQRILKLYRKTVPDIEFVLEID